MSKVAIMGFGTIGSGVYEVIETNSQILKKKAGKEISVKYILDIRDFPGESYENKVVHDINIVVNDPEVDIVVETMGGTGAAYTFVKSALLAGKSVCTSNKALVAKYGPELIKIAKENNCSFLFEASCGGGIPLIRPLITSYTADDIEEISGILNGTTNFILTKMLNEGLSYDVVLKEAQELGYAERDPEADVEGYDPCRKIAILASIVYGKNVDFEKIYTEGITKLTLEDMTYVNKMDSAVRLLASIRKIDGKFYAMVAPFIVDRANPLYSVSDVFNAVFIKGNMLGDTMLYGSGAGKLPTASAVVSDIVSAAKSTADINDIVWDDEELTLSSLDNDVKKFFVRVEASKLEKAKEVFNAEKVITLDELKGEAAVITASLSEKEFADKAEELGIISRIRVK